MKYSHADYTIAWICAIPLELAAAEAMLDETHGQLPQSSPASCAHVLGKASGHNVVLTCLPSGDYGTMSAASVTSHIQATFPAVRYGILVGIGGGVPSDKVDIRLGDLVISEPTASSSGVIQYDFGKALPGERFQPTRTLSRPPQILLTAVSQLKAGELRNGTNRISSTVEEALQRHPNMVAKFSKPQQKDRLFQAAYNHIEDENTCKGCAHSHEIIRNSRPSQEPHIHYGTIASGNQVIKDGQARDRITQEHHPLCFEMEAAGIMNHLPCLVIRGICDYCDSHKNKDWQGFAALTAAAYAKLLLAEVPINQSQQNQIPVQAVWMVPFEQNPRFLGRSREVADLEQKVLNHTGVQKVAISGLGGVGKTQIALELAYRIRERDLDRSIFWIPSTSAESVEQAFLSISKHIGLQEVTPTDVKMAVKNYLSSERANPWLLIIDNADDIEMWTVSTSASPALRTFLPQGKHGFVLFTTRNQQLATKLVGPEVMRIQEMDATMSADLLKKSLIRKEAIEDEESTAKLVDQLHGLPLAIIQAASYINENWISLAKYILLLNQQESGLIELLSQDFEDDWRYKELQNPVAMTWLISFDQIRRLNSLAADHLSFMSCVDPRDIPQSLLPYDNNDSVIQQQNALGLLKSYSFVTEQTDGQYSIHRLVHLATRNWLRNESRLIDWIVRVCKRLEEVFPSNAPENRLRWREYLPHAQCVLRSTENLRKTEHREELSDRVGQCLHSDGRYNEAKAHLQEVYETREKVLGQDHPDTLTSLGNLGGVLYRQGKYDEAEAMHRRALETREKVLGRDHPDTLTSVSNLGLVLNDQGKYDEAEAMHRRALETREKVLGPDHPNTLTSVSNLGLVLNDQGKYDEAEAMHRRALETREKVLGPDHPNTLTSVSNLGLVLDDQGKYDEAEAMHRRAFKTSEKGQPKQRKRDIVARLFRKQ